MRTGFGLFEHLKQDLIPGGLRDLHKLDRLFSDCEDFSFKNPFQVRDILTERGVVMRHVSIISCSSLAVELDKISSELIWVGYFPPVRRTVTLVVIIDWNPWGSKVIFVFFLLVSDSWLLQGLSNVCRGYSLVASLSWRLGQLWKDLGTLVRFF